MQRIGKRAGKMQRIEINQVFDYLVEMFPRFHDSEAVKDLWFESLGKRYHKGQVIKAIKQFARTVDKMPSLASIQSTLDQVYGIDFGRKRTEIDKSRKHYMKIDACMDALGVDVVIAELKGIVGEPSAVKWADLVERKDWIPAYRAKLDEMFGIVRTNYPAVLAGVPLEVWE